MAVITKPILLDETGKIMSSSLATIAKFYNKDYAGIIEGIKQKEPKVVKNITIQRESVLINDDLYKDFYPFYADYAISGMTDTCTAEVVTHPSADEEGCYSGKCNTMYGKIRLYFLAQPVGNTTIEAIVWKELA